MPEGRTLFVVNVPPDATEREIMQLFKHSGTVEKVVFSGEDQEEDVQEEFEDEVSDASEQESEGEQQEQDEQPRKKRKLDKNTRGPAPKVVPLPERNVRTLRKSGRSVHVVFLDDSSLARALARPPKPRPWPQDETVPSGLEHYVSLYKARRPPLDIVKAHADSWMEHFEYEQAKTKRQSKYKKGEAVVDEDGFTLVTRGGAYGQTVGGGVGVASKRFQKEGPSGGKRNRKNKKEPKEKEAFYAFQVHEKKRKGTHLSIDENARMTLIFVAELMDLKQKWEEDKEKVEKLKESRRFKPY